MKKKVVGCFAILQKKGRGIWLLQKCDWGGAVASPKDHVLVMPD
jgi:hypothetical protein